MALNNKQWLTYDRTNEKPNGPEKLGKKSVKIGIRGRIETIVNTDLSIQKRHWELRKLAVTLTPIKDHKLMLIWKIHKAHLISTRRPDLMIVNKKEKLPNYDFAVPADHRVKVKATEKRDKYLDFARELKNCGTWK